MSACLNDAAFGPTVQGCRGNFDFTMEFEMIFLDALPTSVFIIIFLTRIAYLATQRTVASEVVLRASKTVSIERHSNDPMLT